MKVFLNLNNKYTVIENSDIKNYLSFSERCQLNALISKIYYKRLQDNKKPINEYLVINIDEEYASEVAEIMKKYGHY